MAIIEPLTSPNDTHHGITAPQAHRVAYYGGTFDPVHKGHLAIARKLLEQFDLDAFIFIPAYHAPHKVRLKPTSGYDRYAMLCLVTNDEPLMRVSRMEIEMPEHPYSVETLTRLKAVRPDDEIYFVMGADSWMEITTWREWETVLSLSNHIVVTRPGIEIGFDHVTDDIRSRIVDLRRRGDQANAVGTAPVTSDKSSRIYITDAVEIDVSATEIRRKIRGEDTLWHSDVAPEVANYIEKYQIYS